MVMDIAAQSPDIFVMHVAKKAILTFAVLCGIGFGAAAQSVVVNDTPKAQFVSLTVNDFFAYWEKMPFKAVPERTITLITDIDASLLPDTVIGLPIVVLDNVDMLRKRKYRKLMREQVFKVKVDTIASDTIDVNLIRWNVSIKGKWLGIAVECGGDMGYIPDGRFVYDAVEKRWMASFYEELCEQKAKEDRLKYKHQ